MSPLLPASGRGRQDTALGRPSAQQVAGFSARERPLVKGAGFGAGTHPRMPYGFRPCPSPACSPSAAKNRRTAGESGAFLWMMAMS